MSFKKTSKVKPAIRWIYDRKAQVLRTEDGKETPLTPASLPKEEWLTRIHPEDRNKVLEGFQSLLVKRANFFEVYRMRDEEGTYHWVLNVGQWLGDHVVGRVFLLPDLILRMRDALPFFPLPSIVLFESQILWTNLSFVRLLGYETPTSLLGQSLHEFVHPPDQPAVDAALASSADARLAIHLEPTPGAPHPVTLHVAALFGGQYHVVTVVPTKTLTETPSKIATFERFFENDLTGDFLSTPEGTFLLCNPAFAQILGYSSVEEILKINARTLYRNPQDRDILLERLKKEKKITNFEVELVRKDGTPIHVLENIVGIFDDENRLVQIQGTLIDITDRKHAELRLKQQESRLRRLVESLHEGLVLLDLNGVITYANPQAHKILRQTPGTLMGKSFTDFFPVSEELKKLLQEKTPGTKVTVEFPVSSHEKRYLQVSVSPYWSEEGEQTGVALLFIDVTEQTRREQEIQIAQKEAQALRTLHESLREKVRLEEIAQTILHLLEEQLQAQGGVVLLQDRGGDVQIPAENKFPEALLSDLVQWFRGGFFHQEALRPLVIPRRWLANLLPPQRLDALMSLNRVVVLPLFQSGRPIGTIVLYHELSSPLPEGWDRIAVAVAREAASAFSTASLLHALEARTRELTLLDRIHRELSTILEPEEAIQRVIETTVDEMGYVLGYSVVYDPKRQSLLLTHLYPMDDRMEFLGEEFGIAVGTDAFAYPVDSPSPLLQRHFAGEIVKGNDLSSLYSPVWDRRKVLIYQTLLGIRSFIKVPILIEGEFHASLLFASPRPQILESEERTLGAIADRLSMVLSRAQLVKQIADSEEKYRRLIYKMQEGLMVFDEQDRITFVNPRICEILGMEESELLKRPFLDFLDPESREKARPHQKKRRLGVSDSFTVSVRRKGGEVRTLRVHGSPLFDEENNFVGSFAVIDDITDLATLERQLVHAQKMESIGRLAGGVAHDFNNILTIIAGHADLIAQQIREEDPLYEHVDQIRKAAQKGAHLTKRLLVFSRRKVGRPELVDVNRVIQELKAMLHRIIGEQIQLRTELTPDLWPVQIEPSNLEAVITNLITNARDAMPEGGTITIRTKNVVIREPIHGPYFEIRPGEYVLLSVSDTGVGMTEEVLQHIFEPFFTTKEAGEGTGLGLSTVYGIVRQSQGAIQVETALGKGTTFHIYFPRGPEVGGKEVQTVEKSRDHLYRGGWALVVEDEESVRSLMAQIIRSMGFQVLEAENGQQAIGLLKEAANPVRIMITDYVLPDLRGEELAQAVLDICDRIEILFVSGYFPQDLGIQETGHHFLQKPFTPDELRRKVQEILKEG